MRLGHINLKRMKKIEIPGVKFSAKNFRCDACLHGKVHSFAHPHTRLDDPSYEAGECLHTDHRGPYARSLRGARYTQLFLDMKSRYKWTIQMSSRESTYCATEKVISDCTARSGRHVRYIKTDEDGVFTAHEFTEICLKEKIVHEFSAPYDHNTNPFIEREQRTILEGVATAMYQSGAPARFWGECEKHLVFTLNNIPSQEVERDGQVELWSNREVLEGKRGRFRLSYLQAFGTACVCYIPRENRPGGKSPTQKKAYDGAIVGYTENMDAYRVWAFERQKIFNVSFGFVVVNEGFFPFRNKKTWDSSFMSDPITFYPTKEAFLVDDQWRHYEFDEKQTTEILDSGVLAKDSPEPNDMNRSESREELDQKHTEAEESAKNTETDRHTLRSGREYTTSDGRTKSLGNVLTETDRQTKTLGSDFTETDDRTKSLGNVLTETDRQTKTLGSDFTESDGKSKSRSSDFTESDGKTTSRAVILPRVMVKAKVKVVILPRLTVTPRVVVMFLPSLTTERRVMTTSLILPRLTVTPRVVVTFLPTFRMS